MHRSTGEHSDAGEAQGPEAAAAQRRNGAPAGAVTTPIVRSSTFAFPTAAEGAARFEGAPGHIYSRLGNPTVAALESRVASLEGGESAVCTASGMGAVHVALMSLLEPGARVVADPCVYGCTYSLLERLRGWGVDVRWVDTTDGNALVEATSGGVDVVFVETPMNPTLRLVDLDRAADAARAGGGRLVVDNTFATPVVQRPLEHGADLVVHSLTKAVGGHSDLLGGAVVGSAELVEPARAWVRDAGPVMDPETAWLALRGAETLELRVGAMARSARTLAAALHDEGYAVSHPLLPDHPDHAVALRQMPRGVSVLTVDLGTRERAWGFLDGLRAFTRAVSLGGVESLACHPASTTHKALPPEAQARARISPGLVRLSVGVEPVEALLEDVRAALPPVEAAAGPGVAGAA